MAPRPKPAAERFSALVMPVTESGCHLWLGTKTSRGGYGMFSIRKFKNVLAHRFAYEAANGSISNGLTLDHLCRVRCCVNPAHLEPVTRRENIRRGYAARGFLTDESRAT